MLASHCKPSPSTRTRTATPLCAKPSPRTSASRVACTARLNRSSSPPALRAPLTWSRACCWILATWPGSKILGIRERVGHSWPLEQNWLRCQLTRRASMSRPGNSSVQGYNQDSYKIGPFDEMLINMYLLSHLMRKKNRFWLALREVFSFGIDGLPHLMRG